MGSFNIMCNVSNLVMTRGDKVACTVIGKNKFEKKKSMIVYNTDKYVPISLPFFGIYDDYGYVELPKDGESVLHNKMAWFLLRTLIDDSGALSGPFDLSTLAPANRVLLQAFGKERGVHIHDNSDEAIEKNILALLNDYLPEQSDGLSVMPVDYNVYKRLVKDSREQPARHSVWHLGEESTVSFADYTYSTIKDAFKDPFPVYDRTINTTHEAKNLISNNIDMLIEEIPVPLHDALFDNTRANRVSFVSAVFYQILVEEFKKDERALTPFIDSYCFNYALTYLNVPYSLKRYGSQTVNEDTVLQSILGTIQTMKSRVAQDYVDGNILELGHYLNKEEEDLREMSEEKITDLLRDVSLNQLEDIMKTTPCY